MEKEPEILKIGETYESKPDGTLVYKSPILSKDTREVVGIEETAIANHTPMTNAGTFTGTASGCGYDKESAAIAEALNQCDSVLQLLYTYKENALAAGESDESKAASYGRSNGSIIGYGAGYGAIPYFEGGAGVSCFWSILKKCGFEVRGHHGTHSDFYTIEKGVA